MPVAEHLGELRKRIIVSAVSILSITIAVFALSGSILRLMLLPLGATKLVAFDVMDGFMIRWRISFYTGVALAFPIWAFQLYAFVKPGLYERERRAISPVLLASSALFLLGAAFGYYLLSSMIGALRGLFPSQVDFMPSATAYLSFVAFFLLACGIAFQLPCVVVVLARLRVLKASTLGRQRKVAYFILFIVAELITPVSDPIVAPLTIMAPLAVLFEGSLLWARRIERKQAAADRATQARGASECQESLVSPLPR
jgi:sec-independent protein translocase protein TatC